MCATVIVFRLLLANDNSTVWMFFRANFKLEYISMEEVKRFVHFWTECVSLSPHRVSLHTYPYITQWSDFFCQKKIVVCEILLLRKIYSNQKIYKMPIIKNLGILLFSERINSLCVLLPNSEEWEGVAHIDRLPSQ